MSFILDALRKSDSEHQQQRSPEYVPPPAGGRRRRIPKWLWFFGALLAVNAVLLGAMMLRGGGDPPAGPGGAAATVSRAAPVPATQGTTSAEPVPAPPKAPVRSLLEETVREAREARAAQPEPQPAAPQPDARTPVASLAADRQAATAALDLRTLDELRARGDISIPDLHVDLHVYATERAGRFLFINGRRYNEGDRMAEGPSVVQITDFGAILEYDRRRFLLPRE